jgi:hypothetical protein
MLLRFLHSTRTAARSPSPTHGQRTDEKYVSFRQICKGTVGRRLDIGRIDIYLGMYKIEDESLGVRALGIRGGYIHVAREPPA